MKAKVIDTWKDSDYGATNYLYDLGNGRRLVYTYKLACSECVVRVLLKGGALYEKQLGLPLGTAHFLEHMLCRPNKVFKTQEEMDIYCFGTRDEPAIYNFAYTTDQLLCFGVDTHVLGYRRAIDFLSYVLDYPVELFSKYIEEERDIILAEAGRYPSERKNEGLEFNKFILDGKYKRYYKRMLGDKKSIKKVTVNDLEKLWNAIRKEQSTVVVIQSGVKPTVKLLNEFSTLFNYTTEGKFSGDVRFFNLDNKLKIGYFKDDKAQNVGLEIGILKPRERFEKHDFMSYKRSVMYVIAERVLSFLLHKYLRDEKHLVYEINNFNTYVTKDWSINGFFTNFEKGLEQDVIENIWDVIYGRNEAPKYETFLKSEMGEQWLEHEISKSVFVMNIDYDKAYAENIAYAVTCGYPPYKFDRDYVKENITKKITTQNIIKFIKDEISSKEPYLWIKHKESKGEMKKVFEKAIYRLKVKVSYST